MNGLFGRLFQATGDIVCLYLMCSEWCHWSEHKTLLFCCHVAVIHNV